MSDEQMQAFIDHPAMGLPPFDAIHTDPEDDESFVSFHNQDDGFDDPDMDLDGEPEFEDPEDD
jgi:hypothetical protein